MARCVNMEQSLLATKDAVTKLFVVKIKLAISVMAYTIRAWENLMIVTGNTYKISDACLKFVSFSRDQKPFSSSQDRYIINPCPDASFAFW